MEWLKLQEFSFEQMESIADLSNIYILMQSAVKELSPFVIRCLFHNFKTIGHVQLP